jgi:hypothetical protein
MGCLSIYLRFSHVDFRVYCEEILNGVYIQCSYLTHASFITNHCTQYSFASTCFGYVL